jgi:putative hydrolase of the HAD superfamily
VAPVLLPLPGIKAVLWDVYGTLLISASGDVGTAAKSSRAETFLGALAAVGYKVIAAGDRAAVGQRGVDCLLATIERAHTAARARGIEHPEVDIRHIWQETLATLVARGDLDREVESVAIERLATHYECLANPCWPMPHARDALSWLRQRGVVLGIVSNAQFYTRELLPTLLGASLSDLGFDRHLRYYSFRHREAKPGARMFALAAGALRRRSVAPGEALYVGNDMLNDVLPAHGAGFRTALFAGDARSLRLRTDDPRVRALVPDIVLTDLARLAECIAPG